MIQFEDAFKKVAEQSEEKLSEGRRFETTIKPIVDVTINCDFWRKYVREMVKEMHKKLLVEMLMGPDAEDVQSIIGANFGLMFQLGMLTAFEMMEQKI